MKKYGQALIYTVFALLALLVSAAAIWAVKGEYIPFISALTPARDEFAYETDDKILQDLLDEGDVSAIEQNEYDKYLASLPALEGKVTDTYVPGETIVCIDTAYKDFTENGNRKMPAPSAEYTIPAGYSCTGASDGVLLLNRGGKYGYFLETGYWLTLPEYNEAYAFSGGVAVVKTGGRYGVIDSEGNLIIPAVFDSISDMDGKGITAYKRGNGYTRIVFVKK